MSIILRDTKRFSVLEIHEDEEVEEAKRLYDKMCACIPYEMAREASRQEREVMHAQTGSGGSLTYGEVEYESLAVVFARIREFGGLAEGGVFVDLGSGCGRPVIAAGLLYSGFSQLVGVEILRGLYEMSLQVKREWDGSAESRGDEGGSSAIQFILGSILDLDAYDWTKGNVILANSTCFTIPFFDQIEKIAENCRPGTIFISLTHCLGYGVGASTSWELLDSMRLPMSWGHAEVSISRRR